MVWKKKAVPIRSSLRNTREHFPPFTAKTCSAAHDEKRRELIPPLICSRWLLLVLITHNSIWQSSIFIIYICSVFLVKIVDTKSFRHHPSPRCFALLLKNTNRSQTISLSQTWRSRSYCITPSRWNQVSHFSSSKFPLAWLFFNK